MSYHCPDCGKRLKKRFSPLLQKLFNEASEIAEIYRAISYECKTPRCREKMLLKIKCPHCLKNTVVKLGEKSKCSYCFTEMNVAFCNECEKLILHSDGHCHQPLQPSTW